MTKLNVGSGDLFFEGYTSVDLYDSAADVQADICDLPYEDNSVDEILCLQTVEHVAYNKTDLMLKEMYRVLIPGGTVHIECPDMLYAVKEIMQSEDIEDKWIRHIYGQYYRPWDINRYADATDHEGSKHRTAFTYKRLERLAKAVGFEVKPANRKFMDVPETLAVILCKTKP